MRRSSILLSLCAALCFSFSAAALAAKPHKPPPAPPPPPPPAPSWTGFYLGVNAGYSWGHTSSDYTSTSAGLTELNSDSLKINGAIGGGQVGYNYQFGRNYVAGIEADIQASDERGTATAQVCHPLIPGPGICDFGNIYDTDRQKLEWFGTVRGRLGYLATPDLLIYGTGGFAYGRLTRDDSYTYNFQFFCAAGPPLGGACTPQFNSMSGVKDGWTAGAGLEAKLWGNWTGRIEYLYMELAGFGTSTFVLTSGSPPPTTLTTNSHAFTDNILRFGLNYSWR